MAVPGSTVRHGLLCTRSADPTPVGVNPRQTAVAVDTSQCHNGKKVKLVSMNKM